MKLVKLFSLKSVSIHLKYPQLAAFLSSQCKLRSDCSDSLNSIYILLLCSCLIESVLFANGKKYFVEIRRQRSLCKKKVVFPNIQFICSTSVFFFKGRMGTFSGEATLSFTFLPFFCIGVNT